MKKKLLDGFIKGFQWFIIILSWILFVGFWFLWLFLSYATLVYIIIIPLWLLIKLISYLKFKKLVSKSIIIYGPRGAGKGILFNVAIRYYDAVLSNMDYGLNCTIVSPYDYFESINPNSFKNAITNEWVTVEKNHFFEGKPYFLDDTSVYFPNTEDSYLNKTYKSLPLTVTVLRHLYNVPLIINAQDLERPYKRLRELQLDGYLKALRTIGFGFISSRLPIIRKYAITSYRYYETLNSSLSGLLPFSKLGIINSGSDGLYTTTASALKKQYDATNGTIFEGTVFIKKKHLSYDTRYFHSVIFGQPAIKGL